MEDNRSEQWFPVQIGCSEDGYDECEEFVYLLPDPADRPDLAGETTQVYELALSGIVLRSTQLETGQFSRVGSFKFLDRGNSDDFIPILSSYPGWGWSIDSKPSMC